MATPIASREISLRYVKTIGIVNNGFSGRGFANPYDLAVSGDGRMFVLNRSDPPRRAAIRIGVCNLDEEYLAEFGNGYGSGDGQFVLPVAMAFDSRDRLYVTDEHNQTVSVFDSDGNYLNRWGRGGTGEGEFDGPAGITIDGEDNVYVVDQRNNRVQKLSTDGNYITQWGLGGSGEGQFNLPWGVAVDTETNVYVADWRNDRIQKFSPNGAYRASFGTPGPGDGQLSRPSGVAVDPAGFVYVADWGNERVQVFGPDGSFHLNLQGQATVSAWAEEFFASNPDESVERDKSNLEPPLPAHLTTPHQVASQTEPYFWGPVSVRLDGAGRLYVTESNRHRVQVYQKR